MKFYFKILGFACMLSIVSCSKNNSETTLIDNGYSYFPIDSTKQYLYVVDSISYSNSTTVDTFHFQLSASKESKRFQSTSLMCNKPSLPGINSTNAP